MIKRILSAICALACLLLCMPTLVACGNDNVYELGPYSINQDEYSYLLSSYKRTIIDELGIPESYLGYTADSSSGLTYGQYIEKMYREEFEQSVYALIFSLALFDEYGLELSEEEKKTVDSSAATIIHYYGRGSVDKFNAVAKDYGFDYKTIYSIYEKQAKQSAVIAHILGDNYSKLTSEYREEYYQENYMHFQVLVVNTLYKKASNGQYVNYNEDERKSRLTLEKEITELLVLNNLEYEYTLLPKILGKDDMSKVTYEELWSNPKINDDMGYGDGWYMTKPTPAQMLTPNVQSQALMTKIGDVSATKAKRIFDGDGSIKTENGTEEINKGDYFEYGTAFIKRLEMVDGAWRDEKNKDFFSSSGFDSGCAQSFLFNTLQEYEKSSPYTFLVENELKGEFSFIDTPANYLDYDFLHGTEE